jgi:Uma2 family endonuclease
MTIAVPSALNEIPAAPLVSGPSRKRWTRAECAQLDAAGLPDQQRLELIEGELIDKMGKNRPHVLALALMSIWLRRFFGEEFVLQEAPIDVSPEDNPSNEPEPGLIVLNRDFLHFRSANPGPSDLRLVVEMADTALRFDLTAKAGLYARAGIVEYWVLDVSGRRLIVHREPQLGKYAAVLIYSEQEGVAPIAAPHAMFEAAVAFPE